MYQKILVTKLRAMGDTVISTASLNALRQALPEAEIHGLFPKKWSSLLKNHPAINELYEWEDAKGWKKLKQTWKWGSFFRQQRYEAFVGLHAAGTISQLASFSKAPYRAIHYHGIKDFNKGSTVEISGKGEIKPIIERDFDTLRALGFTPSTHHKTSIHLTEKEQGDALKWMRENSLQSPILAIGLGASRPTKIWPIERFVDVAKTWIEKKKGSVIVLIGPNEEQLAAPFKELKNTAIKVGGDLRLTAALLQKSQIFIGNDSGPKHLAVAVGTKTLTLFGPENPFEWHPYNQEEHPRLFIEQLPCRKSLAPGLPEWCALDVCTKEQHRCMQDISVDQVLQTLGI